MEPSKCKRCGHEWYKRTPRKPVMCPACKSRYWDTERISTLKNEIAKAKIYLSDPAKKESAKEVIAALELRFNARRNQATG